MLEIRQHCENCGKFLPNNSDDAMICSYECTFCARCVDDVLHNVCPNCGGGFEKRPSRPEKHLVRHPASEQKIVKPVDLNAFDALLQEKRHVDPRKR